MNAVAIESKALFCTLGGEEILKGVDVQIHDGEFLGIIGPNGAGKSTLVKCLSGLIPHEGDIKIYEKPIESYARKELAKIISYAPQAYFYYFPYTVFEFILLARYPYVSRFTGFSSVDREAVKNALSEVGIEMLKDRSMGTLSGGELQKVFISSALAQRAKIAILDEPTVFLDPKNQMELLELLLKLQHSDNRTFVIVSHDVNFVAQAARKIVGIRGGKIDFVGTPDDLNPSILKDIYGAEFVSVMHPTTKKPVALIKPKGGEI